MKMPETARFTALIAKDEKRAAADMFTVLQVKIKVDLQNVEEFRRNEPRFGLFSKEFARRHGWHLLGTTSTWFFFDIAFYSQSLFQKDIFTAVGWLPSPKTMNAIEEVYKIARAQSIIALCSTVPGYWLTIALVDRVGRKTIQLLGFFFMTVFMFALAIPYHHWRGSVCGDRFCGGHHTAFLVLYAFTFFFSNFGPNATTFIVPAEIFPARIRSTCHGISAAAGKAGAIIGALGFIYAAESTHISKVDKGYHKGIGVKRTLICLGVTNALGLLCTFLIPETKGKSLEELSRENEEEEGIELEQTHSARKTAPIE
jgi:PHS family inorganic phosphate transporter-like MFS transporter